MTHALPVRLTIKLNEIIILWEQKKNNHFIKHLDADSVPTKFILGNSIFAHQRRDSEAGAEEAEKCRLIKKIAKTFEIISAGELGRK